MPLVLYGYYVFKWLKYLEQRHISLVNMISCLSVNNFAFLFLVPVSFFLEIL